MADESTIRVVQFSFLGKESTPLDLHIVSKTNGMVINEKKRS